MTIYVWEPASEGSALVADPFAPDIAASPAITVSLYAWEPIGAGDVLVADPFSPDLDRVAPVITVPADAVLEFAHGSGGLGQGSEELQALLAQIKATDNIDPAPVITTDIASLGDPIPAGIYTVTATATDMFGNASTATFDITVEMEPPALIADIPNAEFFIGRPFAANYGAYFRGVDSYSIEGMPFGFKFDTTTGKLAGRSATALNPYMRITGVSSVGSVTSNFFSWEVIRDPRARDVSTDPAPTYRETDIQALSRAAGTTSTEYTTYEFTGRNFKARD